MCKVHLHASRERELLVFAHFFSLVIRECFSELCGERLYFFRVGFSDRLCVFRRERHDDREAGRALDKRPDR